MPHHTKGSRSHRRSHRRSHSHRGKRSHKQPTLKRNAYRIVRHQLSRRPARSAKNIHYAIRPLLPARPYLPSPPRVERMNLEPTRQSLGRRAKTAVQERAIAEAAAKEQERIQKEQEKEAAAALRHSKQEKKAAHAAAVSNLDAMFSKMSVGYAPSHMPL